jgi:hypothetical protein
MLVESGTLYGNPKGLLKKIFMSECGAEKFRENIKSFSWKFFERINYKLNSFKI